MEGGGDVRREEKDKEGEIRRGRKRTDAER